MSSKYEPPFNNQNFQVMQRGFSLVRIQLIANITIHSLPCIGMHSETSEFYVYNSARVRPMAEMLACFGD